MTINPDNVKALVVGIEAYRAGARYDLDGPARDALKLAQWLFEKGVPAANIELLLSPLAKNESINIEAQAFTPKPATREQVSQAITYNFLGQGGKDKVLYVFWAGHGFITKTGKTARRLFFADTDTTNKWNLNFDSLLEDFQTSGRGTVFPKQIFFVDACANPIFSDFYPTIQAEKAEEGFGTSGTQGKAEQYALFAAAEYNIAIFQDGSGRFANAVLEELQGQPLIPDMREVAIKIKQNFSEKQQIEPVFWSFSVGGGDRDVVDHVEQKISLWQTKTGSQSLSLVKLSPSERLQLNRTLNGLPLVQFELLVNALAPPAGLIPPNNAEQGLRSSALLRWIEGPTGPGLNELEAVLGEVMLPPPSVVSRQSSEKASNVSPEAPAIVGLSPGQSLKLQDRQKKLARLQERIEKIDRKIAGGVDFEDEEKYETRKEYIFQEIDLISQEIRELEQGNG